MKLNVTERLWNNKIKLCIEAGYFTHIPLHSTPSIKKVNDLQFGMEDVSDMEQLETTFETLQWQYGVANRKIGTLGVS
jgi:hypothetical protein